MDAEGRLSESLKSANAFLSMLEIADHSDRSSRVREVLRLWLDSSRQTLADHLGFADRVASGAGLDDPAAIEFLEELKILWTRLDRSYADLDGVLSGAIG